MGRRLYWKQIAVEALRRAVRRVMNSPGSAILSLGSAFGLIWGLSVWGSPDAAQDEIVTRTVVAALSILFLAGTWVWELVSIPSEMDARNRNEIVGLKERLRPVIRVSWDEASGDYTKPIGKVQRSRGGYPYSDLTRTLSEVRVRCEVDGAVSVNAKGYLVSATDCERPGVELIGTPIQLRWSHEVSVSTAGHVINPGIPSYLTVFQQIGSSDPEIATNETAEAVFACHGARRIQFCVVIIGNGIKGATVEGVVDVIKDDSGRWTRGMKIVQVTVTQAVA